MTPQEALILYETTVKNTYEFLHNNAEWESRYRDYLTAYNNKKEQAVKELLREMDKYPFEIYTSLDTEIKSLNKNKINLRYKGQSLLELTLTKENKWQVGIGGKQQERNVRWFQDCKELTQNIKLNHKPYIYWDDIKENLKNYFMVDKPTKSPEHSVETKLISELEKKIGSEKKIKYIQPIKINNKRFQFPTPFSASDSRTLKINYSKHNGGGIDIFARRKTGRYTQLCVIELKDENKKSEPPEIVMKQAIAYAVFVRQLIRNKVAKGSEWYKNFGSESEVPAKLVIKTVVAMPEIQSKQPNIQDYCFELTPFKDDHNGDCLKLCFVEIDKTGAPTGYYTDGF